MSIGLSGESRSSEGSVESVSSKPFRVPFLMITKWRLRPQAETPTCSGYIRPMITLGRYNGSSLGNYK